MLQLRDIWEKRLPGARIAPVSALHKTGISDLRETLVDCLPLGPMEFDEDTLTDRNERFYASEIIREGIFLTYKDEIPYNCEVRVDEFKDRSPTLSAIEATIMVAKDSQKAIVIGKGGEAIKSLNMLVRPTLEAFLDRKVHLQLKVTTDEGWHRKPASLLRYGYIDSE